MIEEISEICDFFHSSNDSWCSNEDGGGDTECSSGISKECSTDYKNGFKIKFEKKWNPKKSRKS